MGLGVTVAETVFEPAFEFVDVVEIDAVRVDGDFFDFEFAVDLDDDGTVASFDLDDFVFEVFLSLAKLVNHFHLVDSLTHGGDSFELFAVGIYVYSIRIVGFWGGDNVFELVMVGEGQVGGGAEGGDVVVGLELEEVFWSLDGDGMVAVFVDGVEVVIEGVFGGNEDGVVGEIGADEVEVGGELVGDGGGVFVAVDVVVEAGDEHESEEDGEWEDGEDAGVRVGREETIPFF